MAYWKSWCGVLRINSVIFKIPEKTHFLFQKRAASELLAVGSGSPLGCWLFWFWRECTWGSKALWTARSAFKLKSQNKIQVAEKEHTGNAYILHIPEAGSCHLSKDEPEKKLLHSEIFHYFAIAFSWAIHEKQKHISLAFPPVFFW